MITHLSLFSGIGGLDLAAEWAGITTVGQCEWAEYPTKVLEKHWPDIPRWKDIRTLTGERFYEQTGLRTVDIISGGFPCQPFSVAGKQRGKEDDRYLWPEMVRVIQELRPTWVIGENVAGIVRMVLPDILSELEACGYRTRTFLIPACAVGAKHRRYRVAIVGHSDRSGCEEQYISSESDKQGFAGGRCNENVCNTLCSRCDRFIRRKKPPEPSDGCTWSIEPELGGMADGIPTRMDGYWEIGPDIPKTASGIPKRVERIRCLGNAVVPQQFYPIFKAITEIERSRT